MITKLFGDGTARLLEIDNGQCDDCGKPPKLNAKGKYLGYFENRYGEQWIFVGELTDRRTTNKLATLYCGDCGWDFKEELNLDGHAFPFETSMDREERGWLQACWMGFAGMSQEELLVHYEATAANHPLGA